jgi:hypothetical protein
VSTRKHATVTVKGIKRLPDLSFSGNFDDAGSKDETALPSPSSLLNAQAHVDRIRSAFDANMHAKYMNGAREHGGDLDTKGSIVWLLDMLEEEVIDSYVYLRTIRERILGKNV